LRFVPEWDRLYHEEITAAQTYSKAILSLYLPGFNVEDPLPSAGDTSRGSRLCTCEFTNAPRTKHGIIRINSGHDCRRKGILDKPYQTAYIAAGFFFTRAEFLTDVPFDPYLPWIFMGEEIALSLRAWTWLGHLCTAERLYCTSVPTRIDGITEILGKHHASFWWSTGI
jgi:hypothetical protein